MMVERGMPEDIVMSDAKSGQFSLSLKSLQLQLQTLLEDAGGQKVLDLLDALCRLNSVEQQMVLGVFGRLLDRVLSSTMQAGNEQSAEQQRLEDAMFQDIVSAMRGSSHSAVVRKYRFEVVAGGKSAAAGGAGVVHIEDLRQARRSGLKLLQ